MKTSCLDQSCVAIAQGACGIGWLQSWAQKLGRADPTAGFPHFVCGNFKKILMFGGFVVGRFSGGCGEVEGLSFTGNKNLELCQITVVTKISAWLLLQILAYSLAK